MWSKEMLVMHDTDGVMDVGGVRRPADSDFDDGEINGRSR
jgi:hypothetical protein